jgi:hypothetical protein
MSEEANKYWDTKQWPTIDGIKADRLITQRKAFLNHLGARQRENAADLEYAKHLLDQPYDHRVVEPQYMCNQCLDQYWREQGMER